MKTVTSALQITLDPGIRAELDYLMELNRRDPLGWATDSVEDLIAYVLMVVADGSRRPGSWERTVISAMGLISSCPEHAVYRSTYGPPSGSDP